MIVVCSADDIVGTTLFTGVFGNYLRPSVAGAGLNPDDLPRSDPSKLDFRSGEELQVKAWRDIWGCGQGIGMVSEIVPTEAVVARLAREYSAAKIGRASGRDRVCREV